MEGAGIVNLQQGPAQGVSHRRVAGIIRLVPDLTKMLDNGHAAAPVIEPNCCTGYTYLPLPFQLGRECGQPTEAVIPGPAKQLLIPPLNGSSTCDVNATSFPCPRLSIT